MVAPFLELFGIDRRVAGKLRDYEALFLCLYGEFDSTSACLESDNL